MLSKEEIEKAKRICRLLCGKKNKKGKREYETFKRMQIQIDYTVDQMAEAIEKLLQYIVQLEQENNELKQENNEMAEMICRLDVVNNYKLFNKDVKKVKQYFEKKVKSQMNKEKIEKADKIFEELGYEKTRDGEDCWCVFTKKNEIEVSFEKNIQEVFIEILYDSKEDKEHKAFERIVLLNKKLRKAINLKCEELGFNV